MEAVIVARNSKEIQTAHALLQKVHKWNLDFMFWKKRKKSNASILIILFDLRFILITVFDEQAVEGLLDGLVAVPGDPELMLRYRDCHLLVLKGLQDHRAYGSQWTNKQVTR